MDYVGLTLRESLPMIVDKLVEYGLRERIKVIASGKLITPGKVAWALACGADIVTSARGFMFALGCIQALQCNKNTCPTGITTHQKELQRGLVPAEKSLRVASFAEQIIHDVGVIAHSCGVSQPRELERRHVRIIESGGLSVSLAEQYPEPVARQKIQLPPSP